MRRAASAPRPYDASSSTATGSSLSTPARATTPEVSYPLATREELDGLAATCGDAAVAHVADVRDRAGLQAAVDLALDRWGRLDAAVAAAAVIAGGRPLWETSDDDLDLLWDVDVSGVWNTAAVAVPAMLAGPDPQGCRFVAVASAAASHGLFGLAGYNAAKHAVVGMVKGLAADLVGTGVTACAVSPGSTRTPMLSATADLYDLLAVDDFAGQPVAAQADRPRRGRRDRSRSAAAKRPPSSTAPSSRPTAGSPRDHDITAAVA